MKFILTLIACILACNFLLVSGAAFVTQLTADEELPYPISTAIFLGEVNGVPYNISGTISSVLAELENKHPDGDFAARGAANENATAAARMESRSKIWNPTCFPRGHMFQTTGKAWFETIISWGHRVGGTVYIAGKSCAFINCRLDARMFMCNDRDEGIDPGLSYMVSYITDICNYRPCMYWSVNFGMQCGGQMFDSDNYSVLARRRRGDEDKCWNF